MKRNHHETPASVAHTRRYSQIFRTAAFAVLTSIAMAGFSSAWAQAPQIVEVRPGDSFASIAGPLAGGISKWRKLYRPELSGLANPNLVTPGMRFELVSDANGQKYLRRIGSTVAPAPAVAAAPPAMPARPAAPAAPAPAAAPAAPAVASAAPAPAPVAPAAARSDGSLVIGVLPNISSAMLTTQYEHMKRYLERVSGSKVSIVVPPNFKAMFDNTMSGEYDIAITAPHFARVAQADRGLVPLGMYEPRINALFITPIETTITNARDVRGKAVGFANPTSLVAMFGQQWLRGQGLEAGKDYEVRGARTDMSVGRALLTGEAVAAVMSNGEFRSLPPAESGRLKILESFSTIPNFVILAHPRLGRDRMASLRGQLRAFFEDKEDGAAFINATNLRAIVDADEAQLRELDAHTAATRQLMGVSR